MSNEKDDWTNEAEELPAGAKAARETRWPDWARKDLWSYAELAALCCGFVPDELGMAVDPGKISGDESRVIAINRAAEWIRRGMHSAALVYVPRSDADTPDHLYRTDRHFVPLIAAEWAVKKFDTFPPSLLTAVREYASAAPAASVANKEERQLGSRERNILLRIIRALDAMNPRPLPDKGYAESIRAKLDELGLITVSDDTIRKAIEEARKLDS